MKVLGLVPARGGSKGVPGKNIKILGGKPLLAYTAISALQAKSLSRVILSTDDEAIADIGRRYGLDVPFMRPADLARDESPTLPVIRHALKWLAGTDEEYDAVCLLQPTNPLRRALDIDACVEMLERSDADSVISVLPVPPEYNPHWVYVKHKGENLRLSTGEPEPISRRQELPPAFHRDGSVYVTRADTVLGRDSLYGATVLGYEMDPAFCINIDTQDDWDRALLRIDEKNTI